MINAILGIGILLWLVCGIGGMLYVVNRAVDRDSRWAALGLTGSFMMLPLGPVGLVAALLTDLFARRSPTSKTTERRIRPFKPERDYKPEQWKGEE